MLSSHIKDILKVSAAASTNVVAAGATAAVSPGAQQVLQHGSLWLHDAALICQIVVGLLSGAYVCFKFWRAVKDKKPID